MVTSALVVAGSVAGCDGSGGGSQPAKPGFVMAPPVAPCSLLTAREVSAVLDVHVLVKRSRLSCAFQGTRGQVFRAVVVSPQRLTAATRPARYEAGNGPIVKIGGPGYRGQAQNDPVAGGQASGLAQSNAQIVSGHVFVRLLATYHTTALRGAPQPREVTKLGEYVGGRLARHR